MGILLDRLAQKKLLVSDGAWGTMLQAAGLTGGACPEEWNITHPEQVEKVARAYQDAGADLVLSNTFGGTKAKLEKVGLGDRVAELNEAGAKLSLAGAPNCIVAASVGPTGEFMEPVGEVTEDQMQAFFEEQIAALYKGGVRAVCIETMSAIEEIVCAIRAAKKIDKNIDVIATMTFEASPKGYKTMMGVDCERAAKELDTAGADVIGANCGNGIDQMIIITGELRKYSQKPILIHANAGLPVLVNGQTTFKQTPQDMAAKVKELIDAGASIIGGCCGTTPAHITAIKAQIDQWRS
jgi:5-methyltetrahydrofolate--homocysteine methyltransferase